MTDTISYTATLGMQHDNQLLPDNWLDNNGANCAWNAAGLPTGYPKYISGGLPCDGTVYVSSADTVCYADVKYTINGTNYEQTIMNVPFADAVRMPLYFQYFVNNQAAQITAAAAQAQVGQTVKGT